MPRTRRQLEPPIYVFRVRILGGFYAPANARMVWREIAIAANQTLGELGAAIPLAFGFYDAHLWSFFLNGRAWDRSAEYALDSVPGPFDEPPAHVAGQVAIRDVPFPGASGKREFLFLFDFGDEWHFGVKLMRLSNSIEPRVRYPRVVAEVGAAPPQYPDEDDLEDIEEDEELEESELDVDDSPE